MNRDGTLKERRPDDILTTYKRYPLHVPLYIKQLKRVPGARAEPSIFNLYRRDRTQCDPTFDTGGEIEHKSCRLPLSPAFRRGFSDSGAILPIGATYRILTAVKVGSRKN